MGHVPPLQVEEMCSILIKTLRGEITWGNEQEMMIEPTDGYVDAHVYISKDCESERLFVLIRKYTDKVRNFHYNFWPVLFVLNSLEISPDVCITALCGGMEIPVGSTCYNGRDNEIYNNILKSIQLVVEK